MFAFASVLADVSTFLDSGATAVLPIFHTIDYRVHGDGFITAAKNTNQTTKTTTTYRYLVRLNTTG